MDTEPLISWEDIKQPTIDLLLNLYNFEEGEEFAANVTLLMTYLRIWNQESELNPAALLSFIIDQVLVVIHEVKSKLVLKATEKFDLLNPDIFE